VHLTLDYYHAVCDLGSCSWCMKYLENSWLWNNDKVVYINILSLATQRCTGRFGWPHVTVAGASWSARKEAGAVEKCCSCVCLWVRSTHAVFTVVHAAYMCLSLAASLLTVVVCLCPPTVNGYGCVSLVCWNTYMYVHANGVWTTYVRIHG